MATAKERAATPGVPFEDRGIWWVTCAVCLTLTVIIFVDMAPTPQEAEAFLRERSPRGWRNTDGGWHCPQHAR